jgi:hypothetical protein
MEVSTSNNKIKIEFLYAIMLKLSLESVIDNALCKFLDPKSGFIK